MRVVVMVVVVLIIIAIAYVLLGSGRRRPAGSVAAAARPAQVESAEAYRNHLAMARWIELQLKDDLVRSSVADDEQARARRLLAEFYGDER